MSKPKRSTAKEPEKVLVRITWGEGGNVTVEEIPTSEGPEPGSDECDAPDKAARKSKKGGKR